MTACKTTNLQQVPEQTIQMSHANIVASGLVMIVEALCDVAVVVAA